jgi:hypothetical protein
VSFSDTGAAIYATVRATIWPNHLPTVVYTTLLDEFSFAQQFATNSLDGSLASVTVSNLFVLPGVAPGSTLMRASCDVYNADGGFVARAANLPVPCGLATASAVPTASGPASVSPAIPGSRSNARASAAIPPAVQRQPSLLNQAIKPH